MLLASATTFQSTPAWADIDCSDWPPWEKEIGVVPIEAPALNPAETEAPTEAPTEPPTEAPAEKPAEADTPAEALIEAEADSPRPLFWLEILLAARSALAVVIRIVTEARRGTPWSEK